MKRQMIWLLIGLVLATVPGLLSAGDNDNETRLSDTTFVGLKLRSIGPALMSGRIADIAIHPDDDNLWYVAVGSGAPWVEGQPLPD